MDMRQSRQETMMKYCMNSTTSSSMTSYDMTRTKAEASTTPRTTTAAPRRPQIRYTKENQIEDDECWSDCSMTSNFISNPACLLDCFPAHHCLTSLLLDIAGAGGICGGTFINSHYPELWPKSQRNCTFLEETEDNFTSMDDYQIKDGLCSATTEALLRDEKSCITPLYKQSKTIIGNLQYLIWSTCSWKTFHEWRPTPTTVRSPLSNPFRYGINPNIYGKIIFCLSVSSILILTVRRLARTASGRPGAGEVWILLEIRN